ncbi:hypothetical protein GCM10025862_18410 [Arsenicicoccus piscis]|uniref:Class II Histidinyl-tRNA synthetase (HisRS)-like catalytic core domain-containing protein n=1 Tax=Arsenicicoccus piscis TaxID=673954 RepID=A0ABQ6HNW0_9MICO|nr:hypothetical protein GCM10025862_18410 [Arsenicicoccus piscis]
MAQKIAPLSGFPELLPADRVVEQHFLDVIRETFELHGFAGIETRAVEPVERLLGKGGDADKEIYGVTRLAAGADETRDAELGLHFDLTVPFARYVLENAGKLSFPFRRYQIQKVWRGERPQEGATASSPRPTSTSSTPVSCPRTTRPSCRWSSPRRSAGCRSERSGSRSTTARSPRGSTSGSG